MSFAQHFSDLKFSSTSYEVENNDVAEIALHNLRRVAAIDALQRGRFSASRLIQLDRRV